MTKTISIDPEIMGGEPCFYGTRVPIKNLFDHLEDGAPLDDFLQGFPRVSKDHIIDVIELAKKSLFKDLNENFTG
ncbi:hypothetical protein TI05_09120 [Achromatium sp. WMS3]|nr:hypothetical protein TI05_09120 [Achromatium sp. WMS3]